jgi:UDP-N-acetylmuramate--L-alanine ligase/UDP-N-acetylenolpyruvoylglucosamine reductase
MSNRPPPRLFDREIRSVHLVGVGGTGMAPLALCMRQAGFTVSGEDDALSPLVRPWLEQAGVIIRPVGGVPEPCDLLVRSSAIHADHPARVCAVARGVPQVRRGEMLAELLRDRKLVAIVGAHGKTTTTGMLIAALHRAGFPCGWLLGGLFADGSLPPGRLGTEAWIVAEIDESDGTIDGFAPEITVIVSLDWDHPDHYARIEQLEETFRRLVARTRRVVLVDHRCALSARVTAGAPVPVFTFGGYGQYRSAITAESGSHLSLHLEGDFPTLDVSVRARGAFNAHNATAALAALQLMGAPLSRDLLAGYAGACRRQQVLRATERLTIIEDYAHHPTEIRALLASLRERKTGRLVVVFQPHRFSRTARFRAEFAAALGLADRLFLLDVYSAGEAPVPGGATADLYAEIVKGCGSAAVTHLPGPHPEVLTAVQPALQPGDWLAFVGAGDIERWAHEFADQPDNEAESPARCGRVEGEAPAEPLPPAAGTARREPCPPVHAQEPTTPCREKDFLQTADWDRFFAELRPRLSPETLLTCEEPLAPKTTMRTGGRARGYCEPAGIDDLRLLLGEARLRRLSVYALGRGSNLIVPDEGVDGLVVSLAHPAWQSCELRSGGRVWAGAGLRLKALCGFASKAGLAGLEFLEGIPGSVGGALRMNAGAMGGWVFDVVEEVQLITLAGEVRTLSRDKMHTDYRECVDLQDAIALGVLLRPATRMESETISGQIEVYRRRRQESQPREPSAGCIFRNPPGVAAGRLIDELGLKGERVGDAEISPVHANFIVNRGRATSTEIIALIRRVRERVQQARGITLEPEVLLFGREWKDVL